MADFRNILFTEGDFFDRVVGKNCWSFIAGAGTGSMVSLAFGEKIQRVRQLKNPSLSEEQKLFDGEFVLFITESAWRVLDEKRTTICNSDDSNAPNGPMLSGLQTLIGFRVAAISASKEQLSIFFDNGYSLLVERLGTLGGGDGYDLFYLGRVISSVSGDASSVKPN